MTTAALPPARSPQSMRRVNPRRDRIFFSGMALLLTASVVLGFARSYFLAGIVRAPLPSRMIHIHGAIFSLWFVMLMVQAFLIPAGRLRWHQKLGLWTYGLAVLVVVFGVLAATDSLRRGGRVGSNDPDVSFAISMMDMVSFSIVILASYLARRRSDAHKRLVLYATLSIMDAAVDRWPYEAVGLTFAAHNWTYLGFLLLPVVYDLATLRRVHRSTLWAAPLIFALNQARIPIGKTDLWISLSHRIAEHH